LYESLLFLSWSFTALHLVLQKSNHFPFLGLITTPMALFTNAFATFTLPPEMQRATGLVPALQSNWLMMHVTIMIVSYAALLSGCLLSMAFLIVQYAESRERSDLSLRESPLVIREARAKRPIFAQREREEKVMPQDTSEAVSGSNTSTVSVSSFLPSESLLEGTMALRSEWEDGSSKQNFYSPLTSRLDNLSYRILGLGFPLLTIGILSGAVWANEAWGSYWSWDPKETWALITWLVFAIYLHTRLTKNWSGTKPAIIATIGFFVLWICYLGVNLLGTGLHSYGWFQR
jgi:cytochrome c-type biogenesis protein CcsB